MTFNRSDHSKSESNDNALGLGTEPIVSYEVQCVICIDEMDLKSNFVVHHQQSGKRKDVRHRASRQGVVRKMVNSAKISLVGFVAENTEYVVRVKCQNRNGWSGWSECRFVDGLEVCEMFGNLNILKLAVVSGLSELVTRLLGENLVKC